MRAKVQPVDMPWEIGDEAVLITSKTDPAGKARVRVKNRIQRSGRYRVTLLEGHGVLCENSELEVSEEDLDDPTLHDNLSAEDRKKMRAVKQGGWETVEALWHHFVAEGEKARGLEAWSDHGSEKDLVLAFAKHCRDFAEKK
jgi:hypothetical protein